MDRTSPRSPGKLLLRKPRLYQSCSAEKEEEDWRAITYLHLSTIAYVLLNFMYDEYTVVKAWMDRKMNYYAVNTYSQLQYVVKWLLM